MLQLIEKIFKDPLLKFLEIIQKFLPDMLSSIIILISGFAIAWFIRIIVGKTVGLLKIDRFFKNSGIAVFFEKAGIKKSPVKVLRQLLYWMIVFVFMIIALIALKIPAMESLLKQFFLFLPNLFIAVLLLILGYLIANFAGRVLLIALVNAGVTLAGFLSKAAKYVIFIFAIAMALEQVGIGGDTVLIAFSIIFGGIVLSLAVAFGLGGKDLAKKFLEKKFEESPKDDDTFKHL